MQIVIFHVLEYILLWCKCKHYFRKQLFYEEYKIKIGQVKCSKGLQPPVMIYKTLFILIDLFCHLNKTAVELLQLIIFTKSSDGWFLSINYILNVLCHNKYRA